MPDKFNVLEDAVRNLYVQAVWSHKIQEKQADIFLAQYKIMQTVSIICASMTSVGIITTIFIDQFWIKILSTILSFVTVFTAGYFSIFDLNTLTKTHKEAANKLLVVRNKITALIASIKMRNRTISELECDYNKLMEEANTIYETAPQTTDKAVLMAKNALQITEDNSFTIAEIDSYLPEALRKGNK